MFRRNQSRVRVTLLQMRFHEVFIFHEVTEVEEPFPSALAVLLDPGVSSFGFASDGSYE